MKCLYFLDDVTFGEYMKRKGLTQKLADYITFSIAMTTNDVPAKKVSSIIILMVFVS